MEFISNFSKNIISIDVWNETCKALFMHCLWSEAWNARPICTDRGTHAQWRTAHAARWSAAQHSTAVYMRGRAGPALGTTPRTRQHMTGRQRQGRPRFTSIRIVRPLQLLPPSQNKCPSMTLWIGVWPLVLFNFFLQIFKVISHAYNTHSHRSNYKKVNYIYKYFLNKTSGQSVILNSSKWTCILGRRE